MKKNQKSTKVIVDPQAIRKVSMALKSKRLDYYLYFELVYQTGVAGLIILNKTVAEMEEFCKENKDYISQALMNSINEHIIGKKKSDFFFAATRNTAQCLSKRTIENVIRNTGNEFGVENLSVRSLTRTFLYEKLRDCKYSFDDFQFFLHERNRYFANLDSFIDYCGLTKKEYDADVIAHASPLSTLCKECDNIISNIKSIKAELTKPKTHGDRYRELDDFILEISVLTSKMVK